MASCKALTAQLALNDCVTWTGYAEATLIEKVTPAADVFISPIERGADFRNSSLFPAIQSGVPILTTENPKYGIDRELRAWNICRFFDPASPKSLADAISALLKDEDAKQQIRKAMARLAPRLTWEEHARVLDMAYRGEPPEPYDPTADALKDKQ
jgi:glycosyltransferase involved in cell wall biosynthesis